MKQNLQIIIRTTQKLASPAGMSCLVCMVAGTHAGLAHNVLCRTCLHLRWLLERSVHVTSDFHCEWQCMVKDSLVPRLWLEAMSAMHENFSYY